MGESMNQRSVRMRSGPVYSGVTALDIVEQMRRADFDPPPSVREYVARAVARASHYFGVSMKTDYRNGPESIVAERFLEEAIAEGFAEEITTS
jgi:hypothetical protein